MAVLLPPSGETGEDSYQPLAQINVTPMVDVMLVLLVIFMVAAPLLSVGVPLDLPKSTAAAITHPKEPIILSLTRAAESFSATTGSGRAISRLGWRRSRPWTRTASSMSAAIRASPTPR